MTGPVKVRESCRLCGSPDLIRSVPLANVPIISPNVGISDTGEGKDLEIVTAPLDNYLCRTCGLIQLVHVVDPSLIYQNYLYRTSISLGLPEHFRRLAEAIMENLALVPGDRVVEFGSNDGTLLGAFAAAGMDVQGVDPAKGIAAEATASGIPTVCDFFGQSLANSLLADGGSARAIIANNAMANIDDLADALHGVKTLLAPDGAFVFETQYALDVFEKKLIDTIYHEHISCFSVRPIDLAAKRFGLAVFDAERIDTKGGSVRFWLQHRDGPRLRADRVDQLIEQEMTARLYDPGYHEEFGDHVEHLKQELRNVCDEIRSKGQAVAAYGTSVGCAALIHQFELEAQLDCLFDDTPFKSRLAGPGYDLPVHPGERLAQLHPGLVIILAWRYAEPIMAKQGRYISDGGRFLVPLPELKVVA